MSLNLLKKIYNTLLGDVKGISNLLEKEHKLYKSFEEYTLLKLRVDSYYNEYLMWKDIYGVHRTYHKLKYEQSLNDLNSFIFHYNNDIMSLKKETERKLVILNRFSFLTLNKFNKDYKHLFNELQTIL